MLVGVPLKSSIQDKTLKLKEIRIFSGLGSCLRSLICFFSYPYKYMHQETVLKHATFVEFSQKIMMRQDTFTV